MNTDVDNHRFFAVVPAAGSGQRMQSSQPKQYLSLHNKTILEHTLEKLLGEKKLQTIVVPVSAVDTHWQCLTLLKDKRINIIEGGETRCQSVLNGLQHLFADCGDNDWVLVHDVARPCVALADVQLLMQQLCNDLTGGILAVPVIDTIKQANSSSKNANNTIKPVSSDISIASTVDRSTLWHAQTPQMFRYRLLFEALSHAIGKGLAVTDEASAIELMGGTPKIVEGSRSNIKVTHPDDVVLAEFYLQSQDR